MPVNVVTLVADDLGPRSRTSSTAPTSGRATPTCAARCARCSRSPDGLAAYDAWATGLRREETHNRVIAPVVGWDENKGKVKVSPLARWTQDDVDRYIAEHNILVNPLHVRRLPLDRLLALHPTRRSGRRCPERTLGRHRQDRMRNPLMSAPALIALAHGSRDPRSARTVREIVADHQAAAARPADRGGLPRPRAPRRRHGRRPAGRQGPHRDRRRAAAAIVGLPRPGRRARRRRRRPPRGTPASPSGWPRCSAPTPRC